MKKAKKEKARQEVIEREAPKPTYKETKEQNEIVEVYETQVDETKAIESKDDITKIEHKE